VTDREATDLDPCSSALLQCWNLCTRRRCEILMLIISQNLKHNFCQYVKLFLWILSIV